MLNTKNQKSTKKLEHGLSTICTLPIQYFLGRGGVIIGQKSMENVIGRQYVSNYCPKIDKSNVAVARLFFELSMDPLVGNDCPISIFSGLGGHGLSFFGFWQ